MNYIIYGDSKIEESIYKTQRYEYTKDEVIHVNSDIALNEALKIVKFKPFFSDKWFVTVDLDKLDMDSFKIAIGLLKNKKVHAYYRINRNGELYSSIRKSHTLNSLEDLTILNARYPDNSSLSKMILQKVTKYFENSVLNYLVKNLRFNIDKLDEVIDKINELDFKEVSLQDVKKILPPSKTKSIRVYCYSLLLASREELKAKWKEMPIVAANAGTKQKPFQIIEGLQMEPTYLLDLIIKILKDITKVKGLFIKGIFTENSIFKDKDKLAEKIPYLKSLSIPSIREYILVSQEVTSAEIGYCLNEFTLLKQNPNITMEDIYLTTFKLMKRHDSKKVE